MIPQTTSSAERQGGWHGGWGWVGHVIWQLQGCAFWSRVHLAGPGRVLDDLMLMGGCQWVRPSHAGGARDGVWLPV